MASAPDASALLICRTCGTQFATANRQAVTTCFICDDPRQYAPPSGQSFTTMADLASGHRNEFHPYAPDPDRVISIVTTPKVAIGQRCILLRTPAGNILWDCITLLDADTISQIKALGGLHGILISHPHYYSAHVEWAAAFDCPVYLAAEDKQWLARGDRRQVLLEGVTTPIKVGARETGITAIKLGGHFPGSLVALLDGRLFIADTLLTTPSGLGNWATDAVGTARKRPQGMNTFAFMWSIPNSIPLSAAEMGRMWNILKSHDFRSTHGAFEGTDIEDRDIKERVLESMQIQARSMGSTLAA